MHPRCFRDFGLPPELGSGLGPSDLQNLRPRSPITQEGGKEPRLQLTGVLCLILWMLTARSCPATKQLILCDLLLALDRHLRLADLRLEDYGLTAADGLVQLSKLCRCHWPALSHGVAKLQARDGRARRPCKFSRAPISQFSSSLRPTAPRNAETTRDGQYPSRGSTGQRPTVIDLLCQGITGPPGGKHRRPHAAKHPISGVKSKEPLAKNPEARLPRLVGRKGRQAKR